MGRKSGFLVAALVTGAVYWLRQQSQNKARAMPHRDITRWEDEGGAFHGDRALLSKGEHAEAEPAQPSTAGGSTRDAWEFPRG
ncbi:hypothetical protein OVY01_10325 [Robbsia sp. Bb-Pol-6]|uniref:DUF4124 domain-containing protein n=1 Tax=Robbsia betulipollinis TaxID=2981849 RepID=A0ABT3ZM38_9BURK|nr:hypothetical protein [Robbsia betulipollinis]MCY0387621.1 hypothetical protein [Robbsia betulipollinis]